ncbi:MAG: serine protease [Pseudomonadota bacterium]
MAGGLRVVVWILIIALVSGCAASAPGQPETTASPPTADPTSIWHATVVVQNGSSHGSGVIIGTNAVLTAYHVVDDGRSVVEFLGAEQVPGSISWVDDRLDLAILRVAVPSGYRPAHLYCGPLKPDDKLVSIGHPLLQRWVSTEGHLGTAVVDSDPFLQALDFELSLGSSGGPVFDREARVVGISTAILAVVQTPATATLRQKAGDGPQTGIGLMVPSSRFCDQVLQQMP